MNFARFPLLDSPIAVLAAVVTVTDNPFLDTKFILNEKKEPCG